MSRNGQTPLQLPTGETRSFLEDGDTLTLQGEASKNGIRIGFGELRNTIAPAIELLGTDIQSR